jgi:3-deoxy-manno-octulosonate cytidylyltransferase (CMP-KDO synthetase)
MIDEIVQPLLDDPELPMCTSMHEVTDPRDFSNPNVVKVVVGLSGDALYFSRSLIPYPRKSEGHRVFEHIGLYAYRKDFLLRYAHLPQTPLEKLESLEQLRALEHGYRIRVVETRQSYVPLSVDTPEDLEKARALARGRG